MAGLKLIYMGTPDFAVPALAALMEAGHEIAAVYSQPPRPAGRGQKPKPSPVHAFAEKHGLIVRTPENFKSAQARAEFAACKADLAVVAAYGLILPEAVLNAPRFGCLNIHASLLPRWRGAAPIQRAILAGDRETGVSVMQMEKGLDTGPVLKMQSVAITAKTTAASLHDALAALGAEMITEVLADYARGAPPDAVPQAQLSGQPCYAHMLTRAEGRIDWTETAEALERKIRALNPWPGVWCVYGENQKRLKIHAAEIAEGRTESAAGEVLDKNLTVACGGGTALRLVTVQPEGKKPMDGTAFFNGGGIAAGTAFH